MHSIDVRCEVEADPADNIRFSWTYNNTRNVSPVSATLTLTHSVQLVFYTQLVLTSIDFLGFFVFDFSFTREKLIFGLGFEFADNFKWFSQYNDISCAIRFGIDAGMLGKQCCWSTGHAMLNSHYTGK